MEVRINKTNGLLFVIMIMLQLLIAIYYKSNIQDLFIDEYYTLNFSCSNYFPLLWDCRNYSNVWLPKEFWHNLLTVQQGEIFNFSSVYYNTAQDVHPPVYYFIEHFFFSMMPEKMSVWLALFPNFIEFVLAQYLLFLISMKIFKCQSKALLVCSAYGFSVGAINTIVLIRMYMLLTLWCLLYFYISLWYLERKNNKLLAGLFVVNILGFLTHYYFVLFSVFVYFASSFYLLRNKLLFDEWVFTGACLTALIACFGLYPEAHVQIFGNSNNSIRGIGAIGDFFSAYKFNIKSIWLLFDMPLLVLVVLFILNITLKRLLDRNSLQLVNEDRYWKYHISSIVCLVLFILLIAKICPFFESRYFYFLYPFLALASIDLLDKISKFCNYKNAVIYLLVSIFTISPYFIFHNGIIRYEGFDNLNIIKSELQEKNVMQCVFVLEDYDPVSVVHNMGIIVNVSHTYITSIEHLQESNLLLDDNVLVFLECTLSKQKENEILQFMLGKYNMKNTKIYKQRKFLIGKGLLLEKL